MMQTLHRPAWLARRNGWPATRLPRRQIEGGESRFFAGLLLAVPVGVLLWLPILYAVNTALGSG